MHLIKLHKPLNTGTYVRLQVLHTVKALRIFWLYTSGCVSPSHTHKHTNKKLSLEPWLAVKVSRVFILLSWWKCILHYKAAAMCIFACTAPSVFVCKASMYYVSRFFSAKLMCERILCPSLSRGPKPPCQWQNSFCSSFHRMRSYKHWTVAAHQGHHVYGNWLLLGWSLCSQQNDAFYQCVKALELFGVYYRTFLLLYD